jgi:hypothetical protein
MAGHSPELTLQIELLFSYPEGFAQQALGHNAEAVHHACAKQAEITVRLLDDWEKKWRKREQRTEAVNLAGDSDGGAIKLVNVPRFRL